MPVGALYESLGRTGRRYWCSTVAFDGPIASPMGPVNEAAARDGRVR